MSSILDEDYRDYVWSVMLALKHEWLDLNKNKFIFYSNAVDGLSDKNVIGKLKYLERRSVLTIGHPEIKRGLGHSFSSNVPTDDLLRSDYPKTFVIELHVPKFNRLYSELDEATVNNSDQFQNDELVTVRLEKAERFLSLVIDDKPIVIKKFNPDMLLDAVVNHLINKRPGRSVTIYELKKTSGFTAGNVNDLAEILRKAGLKPLQHHFIKEWSKESARIDVEARMTRSNAQIVIDLMTAKNRNKSQNS